MSYEMLTYSQKYKRTRIWIWNDKTLQNFHPWLKKKVTFSVKCLLLIFETSYSLGRRDMLPCLAKCNCLGDGWTEAGLRLKIFLRLFKSRYFQQPEAQWWRVFSHDAQEQSATINIPYMSDYKSAEMDTWKGEVLQRVICLNTKVTNCENM